MNISCAVIKAVGEQRAVLLALESRAGRHPVSLLATHPQIRWRCSDEAEETLRLDGTFGPDNHALLVQEIAGEQLLVCEFPDMSRTQGQPERVWLLGPASAPSQFEHARERG